MNALGTDTVAAWTAYSKIDSLFWMIVNAFGISITTFVGQNYGAGKMDRVHKGVRTCMGITAGATVLLSVILYNYASICYQLFTTDAQVVVIGEQILHFLVPTYFTYIAIEILSGTLRGIGDSWLPMIICCLGICALRVVWILTAVPLKNDILTIVFSYPLTWSVNSVMFIVYYVSVTTVGTIATDWANDGVFGDGWHLFGIGTSAYEEDADSYTQATNALDAYGVLVTDDEDAVDVDATKKKMAELDAKGSSEASVKYEVEDEETLATNEIDVYYDAVPDGADEETVNGMSFKDAEKYVNEKGLEEPDPADYGVWVPGIPALLDKALLNDEGNPVCAEPLYGLIMDGIVAGVGAVLGFVPQMLVLFIFLAFLEACGYMARIAFIMDRIFRRFGLSGKSFIPMLIGSGCGVPGIMASRTIESDRDRKMTIMTTTFIPCGAKLPFIAMVAGAIFGGASWVAPSAYFLGIGAVIVSGIILKKTKLFAGDPAPFVMELPAYHMPTVGTVLRSMWERGWSFIKKAGTIILLSTIFVWFTTYFGVVDGTFRMLSEDEIDASILAVIGKAIAWLFAPLGWGNWQATVASITGLVALSLIHI